jgi:FkbM family methyltransferase
MEGNGCYKYFLVRDHINRLELRPVRSILEIGVNRGKCTLEMLDAFPSAKILGYEVVPEIFAAIQQSLRPHAQRVLLRRAAVTAMHRFKGELGQNALAGYRPVAVYRATNCDGGSYIAPKGQPHSGHYDELACAVECRTLDEAVEEALAFSNTASLDFLKTDAEGSERSFLGCAFQKTLNRIRWIAGEWHDAGRFRPVLEKLRDTHRIHMGAGSGDGAFFCERRDEKPGLLLDDADQWNPAYVPDAMRYFCGIPWIQRFQVCENEAMALIGRYQYDRIGHDSRPLELRSGGVIGEGSHVCERWWWYGPEELTIADECAEPICHLRRAGAGQWVGQWLRYERMPVRLQRI